MKGMSLPLSAATCNAPRAENEGILWSARMTSHGSRARAACIDSAVSTRSLMTSYPPRRSSRISSFSSAAESSTIKTRNVADTARSSSLKERDKATGRCARRGVVTSSVNVNLRRCFLGASQAHAKALVWTTGSLFRMERSSRFKDADLKAQGEPVRRTSGVRPSSSVTSDVVLVVDDDHETQAVIREILEDEGYRIVCAYSAREALAFLRAGSLSSLLVLLDVRMPEMEGFEFLEIAERERLLGSAAVVFMTAGISEMVPSHRRILRKPFSLDDLLDTVRSAFTDEKSSCGSQ
jgi:CheY-like chemotaxis protein